MGSAYRPLIPNAQGRFWSQQLGVFIGPWHGIHDRHEADWVRLFRPDGTLVPTPDEQAKAEHQRAEAERQRAEEAEAEVVRLRALLEERKRTGSD